MVLISKVKADLGKKREQAAGASGSTTGKTPGTSVSKSAATTQKTSGTTTA